MDEGHASYLLPPVGQLLFYLLWSAVSLLFVRVGVRGRRRCLEAQSWLPVPGEVVESHVDGETGPLIRYQYSLGGVSHQGSHSGFAKVKLGVFQGTGPEFVARFQPHAAVTVFVNPHDPADSVLFRGANLWNWVWTIWGGLAMSAVGFYFLLQALASLLGHA